MTTSSIPSPRPHARSSLAPTSSIDAPDFSTFAPQKPLPQAGPTSGLQVSGEDIKNGLAELRTMPGGFSTQLSWKDRLRLRAITKRVHMKNYPGHLITNYEADRIIDVMAPETWVFLIHKHGDMR